MEQNNNIPVGVPYVRRVVNYLRRRGRRSPRVDTLNEEQLNQRRNAFDYTGFRQAGREQQVLEMHNQRLRAVHPLLNPLPGFGQRLVPVGNELLVEAVPVTDEPIQNASSQIVNAQPIPSVNSIDVIRRNERDSSNSSLQNAINNDLESLGNSVVPYSSDYHSVSDHNSTGDHGAHSSHSSHSSEYRRNIRYYI